MKKLSWLLVLPSLLSFADEEPNKPAEKPQIDVAKISEAFGHMIAKNIETLGVDFDMERVAQGLKDSLAGKEAPMSEEECVEALSAAQEHLFKKHAQENLKRAEVFLEQNGKDKNVVALHEGKLQYKIEKTGAGEVLAAHATPIIRFVGKYLDGSVFGASKEDEALSLDETIAGIQEGLIGMKEGEKRILYIHPDLAYGTSGLLPPNSLLTFEVDLIKTSGNDQESAPTLSLDGEVHDPYELASPASDKHDTLR